ncbi:MAG: D-tyrosyl-tRNA(Tyr) deacylase [Deltaproteobacteria bacterium]|nr:D-tyrosyl-tRNA(Tyr) deacylase [Deltaproteobacteria bacterium]
MRAVIQRVFTARVEVDDEVVGRIDRGLCVFLGAGKDDEPRDRAAMADKLVGLRVFPDDHGKMSRSVADVGGAVLLVSQFTVYGDVRRGRRPSFDGAMAPELAETTYDQVVAMVRERGVTVATGRFAAMMRVVVDNDGPVTILVDTQKTF